MKYLLLVLCFLSHAASATLITLDADKANYATNETIELNINVNEMLPDAAELEFDIAFDPVSVEFDFLDIAPSSGVFYDFTDVNAGILTVNLWWFSALDVPAGNFNLATALFTALSDVSPVFNVVSMNQYDELGNLLQPVAVDEPWALVLFATGLIFMSYRRIKA